MSIYIILLTAIGLAMDAFAVSVSSGIAACRIKSREIIKMALLFGLFQAAMPVIGFFLATSFRGYIEQLDHWIAFLMLAGIGGRMLYESLKDILQSRKAAEADACDITKTPEEQEAADRAVFGLRRLLFLAVATSIDALAVGISFAVLDTDIWMSAAIIGVVCLIFSILGGSLGRRLGSMFGKAAEILGGLILIGIGIRILVEHLSAAG